MDPTKGFFANKITGLSLVISLANFAKKETPRLTGNGLYNGLRIFLNIKKKINRVHIAEAVSSNLALKIFLKINIKNTGEQCSI